MDVKVSTLEGKEYKQVESKKSKGKLTFIEKVSRFFLINKYELYGVKSLSDKQLDEYIDYLNDNKVTYEKNKIDLEIKLQKAREKNDEKLEKIASKKPSKHTKTSIEALNKSFEMTNKIHENNMSYYNELDEENNKKLEEANGEKEARDIDPFNIAGFDTKMEVDNLEDKIINQTKVDISLDDNDIHSVNKSNSDEDIIKNLGSYDDIENGNKNINTDKNMSSDLNSKMEQSMKDFNEKANKLRETVKNNSISSIESQIEKLASELTSETVNLVQAVLSETNITIEKALSEIENKVAIENEKNLNLTNELDQTKKELDEKNNVISSKDSEIEALKQALATKDQELEEKNSKIAKVDEDFQVLNDEIRRLSEENTNYKTTISTLFGQAALTNAVVSEEKTK